MIGICRDDCAKSTIVEYGDEVLLKCVLVIGSSLKAEAMVEGLRIDEPYCCPIDNRGVLAVDALQIASCDDNVQ